MVQKESKKEKRKSEESHLRILAAGDFHGNADIAEKLAVKAKREHVDLVVIAGDITNFDEPTEGMIKPFKEKHLKVVFVPGNHESEATADFLREFYDIKNLHGYSVRYKDVGIFGAGGSTTGTGLIGPQTTLEEKELFELLRKGWDKIRYLDKKIMVTHVHPKGSLGEKMSPFFSGSPGLRKAIDQFKPDILLCCHVHEAEGIEEKIGKTKVINVGRNGKIIDF